MESKLKATFVLAVLLACFMVSWAKPATTAGVRIYNDGKYLHCDTLVCPESAERCIVTGQTTDSDPRMVEMWRRCLDRNNEILVQDKKTSPNPNPNEAFHVHLESGRDGTISSSSSSASSDNFGHINQPGLIHYPGGTVGTVSKGGADSIQWLPGLYISMLMFFLNKFLNM